MNKIHFKELLIIISIIAIIVLIVLPLSWEYISNYFSKTNMIPVQLPKANSKVLIVAPHNDDESLGAIQYIKKSIKNGAKVKIMMITNGDGFSEALKIHDKKLFAGPSDYIDFGYKRQRETIDAMTSVGVDIDDIYFLGYPDGGVSLLWRDYFYTPYTSKFTKLDAAPYNNSFTSKAIYTGENLASDIEEILEEFKPDYIVYPHPNDRHPDHWATNAFIKYNLNKSNFKPEKELLYLIHRGDWPVPLFLDSKLYLEPPYKLENTGTTWYSLNLNKEEIIQKETVIRKYKTQFPTLENLLLAFIRQNELFGDFPDYKLSGNGQSDMDIVPSENNRIIKDPRQDSLKLDIVKSSDLLGIYGEISKEGNFHIIIEVDEEIEDEIIYTLDLIIFKYLFENRVIINIKDKKLDVKDLLGKDLDGVSINIADTYIHILIPYEFYDGYSSMFINASTSSASQHFDHTASRVIIK